MLRAVTGFEFGDNEAAVPKTEDNGVAEVSFQVGGVGWELINHPPDSCTSLYVKCYSSGEKVNV